MHILEEWKKSLAYDLKLSSRQIGISLEKKDKIKRYISCIHHQLTRNSKYLCKIWILSAAMLEIWHVWQGSWIVRSVLWTLHWPQVSESSWKDSTGILREIFWEGRGKG